MIVWLMSMPMRRAASLSAAVARIALPRRVVRTNVASPAINAIETTSMKSQRYSTLAPATLNCPRGNSVGKGCGFFPPGYHRNNAFSRKIDAPSAVISGASLGA